MPTGGILFRTVKVHSLKGGFGTMFSIVVDGREYWITAKHIITGKPNGEVPLQRISLDVQNPVGKEEKFESYSFQVFDTETIADVVVLVPDASVQKISIGSVQVSSEKATIGGECQFLGFPFAQSWTAHMTENNTDYKMPFTKHCYIAGQVESPRVWILDGLNNEGFSGGPVLINTGESQRILAVISGYRNAPTEVLSAEIEENQPTKSQTPVTKTKRKVNYVNENSGLISAFSADYAIDAIKRHPIGPIVPIVK